MMLYKILLSLCFFPLCSCEHPQGVTHKIKTGLSKGALYLGMAGSDTVVSRKACEGVWVPTENVWEKHAKKLVRKCLLQQWCVPNYTQAKTWLDKISTLGALSEKCPIILLQPHAVELCFVAHKHGALSHPRVAQFCRNLPFSRMLLQAKPEKKRAIIKLEASLHQEPYRAAARIKNAMQQCGEDQAQLLRKFLALAKKLEEPIGKILSSSHKMAQGLEKFASFAENHPGENSVPSVTKEHTKAAANTALRNGMLQASKNLDIVYKDIEDVVNSLAPQLSDAHKNQRKLDPHVVQKHHDTQLYVPDGSTPLEMLWQKGLWHTAKNAENRIVVTEEKAVMHLNALDINDNTTITIEADPAVVHPQILLVRVHGNMRISAPFALNMSSPRQLQYYKSPLRVLNPEKIGGAVEPLIVVISADSFAIDYNPACSDDVRLVFTQVPLDHLDDLDPDGMGLTTMTSEERKSYQDFYNKRVAPQTYDSNPSCLSTFAHTRQALSDLLGVPERAI